MPSFAPLLLSLAELTAIEPCPEAQATAKALRAAANTDFRPEPPSPLDAGIGATSRLPGAHPAAGLVAEALPWLPWKASPAAALQPSGLAANKAVVTLLAPEGPILSPDLRFGLFYQAPGIYYPRHAHAAAETYTILAGEALWQAGEDCFILGPGKAVHHAPDLPHAMRAGPEGFLAIWRWSGDISFDNYRMLADPVT